MWCTSRLNVGQSFIDEIYYLIGRDKPFPVDVKLNVHDGKCTATYNFDFNKLSSDLGKNLNLHLGTPIVGAGICNRLIQSASDLESDLYLGSPMSCLVGDKLYESSYKVIKSRDVIKQLETEVEFPDIRTLVNQGKINFNDILHIRKKANKFRIWLQEESGHDRNAIIAYHHEVAKESGFRNVGRKSLNIFGVLASSAVGGIVGYKLGDVQGAVIGSSVASMSQYLIDVASKLGKDWKPVVFGNWMKSSVAKLIEKNEKEK